MTIFTSRDLATMGVCVWLSEGNCPGTHQLVAHTLALESVALAKALDVDLCMRVLGGRFCARRRVHISRLNSSLYHAVEHGFCDPRITNHDRSVGGEGRDRVFCDDSEMNSNFTRGEMGMTESFK